jgi:zinc transporter, ZIP family
MEVNSWTVFIAAMITALATGLGVLPCLWMRQLNNRWLGVSNALAGGLMLGAAHGLTMEGWNLSPTRTLSGMVLGLLLIIAANRLSQRDGDYAIADLHQANARRALLILGIMTAHSFAEGIGVGVAFGGRESLGLLITSVIAVHNIPEGLAIGLVLIPRGTKSWKAVSWSIFTSLPQPLMAVPAYLFVLFFKPLLPIGFGLAAGAMIWMVFAELAPASLKYASGALTGGVITSAFILILTFQHYIFSI